MIFTKGLLVLGKTDRAQRETEHSSNLSHTVNFQALVVTGSETSHTLTGKVSAYVPLMKGSDHESPQITSWHEAGLSHVFLDQRQSLLQLVDFTVAVLSCFRVHLLP